MKAIFFLRVLTQEPLHFELGEWIINSMIHQNENQFELYADFQRCVEEDTVGGFAAGS